MYKVFYKASDIYIASKQDKNCYLKQCVSNGAYGQGKTQQLNQLQHGSCKLIQGGNYYGNGSTA